MPEHKIRLNSPSFKKAAAAAVKILLATVIAASLIGLFDLAANALVDLVI